MAGNSTSYGSDFTREPGLGAGLSVDVDLVNGPFSFEGMLLFLNRNFKESYQGANADINSKVFNIPLLLRWQFVPNVSIGLGLFYSHAVGQLTVNSNGAQYKQSYNGDSVSKAPWQYNDSYGGWVGAFGARLPLAEDIDLFGDARYQRSTWSTFYVTSDFVFLVGLRFNNLFKASADSDNIQPKRP